MKENIENTEIGTEKNILFSSDYEILESLKHPVSIIDVNGSIIYSNKNLRELFSSVDKEIRLDWKHPFFPEYRKRIAQAYIGARNGSDKQCFAIVNTDEGKQMPVEIYLFPLFRHNEVSAILVMLKLVDDRLLSFDRSTLSIISEENFQYDNIYFEFSPVPILRINASGEIIKCSHSLEGFIGYSSEEIIEKKTASCDTIFTYDSERIKRITSDIISGSIHFKRIGEIKISARDGMTKVVNLTLYPIIQEKTISAIEIVMEDITQIKQLKEQINSMKRVKLLADITKGFLHTLNNTINVIMSKTQLLLPITEKETVRNGVKIIQESAHDIVDQIRRVQNFIGDKNELNDFRDEPFVDLIEDSIAFTKIQFKVEEKEKNRNISIEKKYFTGVMINTDTRILREIIISMILKVAAFSPRKGTLQINLKENKDLFFSVRTQKEKQENNAEPVSYTVNIFSGVDIRQVAEKLNIKIIEEESSEYYAMKAILPSKMIINNEVKHQEFLDYKLRDLDIIIAEDEPALKKILFELFDKMGNRVFICENGSEALEEYKKKHYDLVITDYDIGGITGIELSARIKEINEKTATILLSGWILNDLQAYKNVIDLFIPKPFKLDDLLKKISRIMKEKL